MILLLEEIKNIVGPENERLANWDETHSVLNLEFESGNEPFFD